MVTFSRHALIKLEQRNIDKRFIFLTLAKPDYIRKGRSGRGLAFKKFRKLYMKVIFRHKSPEHIEVITQYWTKYIR